MQHSGTGKSGSLLSRLIPPVPMTGNLHFRIGIDSECTARGLSSSISLSNLVFPVTTLQTAIARTAGSEVSGVNDHFLARRAVREWLPLRLVGIDVVLLTQKGVWNHAHYNG